MQRQQAAPDPVCATVGDFEENDTEVVANHEEEVEDTGNVSEVEDLQHLVESQPVNSQNMNVTLEDFQPQEPFVENDILGEDDFWNTRKNNTSTVCPCASSTSDDVLLMCLALGLRHNLSWLCQVDILKMINAMYGSDKIPATKFKYLSIVDRSVDSCSYHIYCKDCETYLGNKRDLPERVHCSCGSQFDPEESSFFLSVDIAHQMKELLRDASLADTILSHRFTRQKENSESLEDIYDGLEYRKHSENGILSSPFNFSYNFSTDGVPFGRSSSKTIWPIYVTLNELPPKNRYNHVLLAGLYVGEKDPNQNVFLQPFIEQCNILATEGFKWVHKGKEITSKLIPLCAVVDSVARFQLLNMSGINSYYACTFCYQKAEHTQQGQRFPPSLNPSLQRTQESTERDMRKAFENRNNPDKKKRIVKGVKGPCALLTLISFGLILGFVPEYMHCVLLGCIRLHTELLLESIRKKFWDVSEEIGMEHIKAAIDEMLLKIAALTAITRSPRSIKNISIWKASEWRSWLIFYCVPCLKGLLKRKYLVHLSLLSKATNILLQKSVTIEEVEHAHRLLLRYIFLFNKYFEDKHTVLNIHLLSHICQGVMNWGPLWTHNAFVYEGQNRHLLQLLQSPRQILAQVARKFLIYKDLPFLCKTLATTDRSVGFCESILNKKLMCYLRCDGTLLLGSKREYILTDEENIALDLHVQSDNKIHEFSRMLFNGSRFCTEKYATGKKHNDSYLMTDKFVGLIKRILSVDDRKVYIFLQEVNTSDLSIIEDISLNINHIKEVTGCKGIHHISPRDIIAQCIFMDCGEKRYVCKLPFGCKGD